LPSQGGTAGDRVAKVNLDPKLLPHSTDIRRELSQLLQQFVMDIAEEQVFPQLDKAVNKLPIPNIGPMKALGAQVTVQVYSLTDENVRKQVHAQIVNVFSMVEEKMKVPDCSVAEEAGTPQVEDTFGFLKSKGGFKEFKKTELLHSTGKMAAAMGAAAVAAAAVGAAAKDEMPTVFGVCRQCDQGLKVYGPTHACFGEFGAIDEWTCDTCGKGYGKKDPLFCCDTFDACDWGACVKCQLLPNPDEHVEKVMDKKMLKSLKGAVKFLNPLMKVYTDQAKTGRQQWLDDKATAGQKKIDTARASDTLSDVELPLADFHKAGLLTVGALLKPKMTKMGGKVEQRAAAAVLTDRQHSTDLRREVDLMLQELTVEQAKIAVYPELDKKIQALVRIVPRPCFVHGPNRDTATCSHV
jgi:hypothetical protein